MALDFPASPTVSDEWTDSNGTVWRCTGDTAPDIQWTRVGNLPDGSVTTDKLADGAVTEAKIAPGNPMVATAWVSFYGDTRQIQGSYNVSSIATDGTGLFQINFETSMDNTQYTIICSASVLDNTTNDRVAMPYSWGAGACAVKVTNGGGSFRSDGVVNVAVFGGRN